MKEFSNINKYVIDCAIDYTKRGEYIYTDDWDYNSNYEEFMEFARSCGVLTYELKAITQYFKRNQYIVTLSDEAINYVTLLLL